jgi:hypothetical protein
VNVNRGQNTRGGVEELVGRACGLRAVFCDLDGTFLDGQHQMPTSAPAVVDRLQATGVRFVPTTGRTLVAVHELLGPLADRLDVVAANGLDVVVGGRHAAHASTSHEDALLLARAVLASDRELGFVAFETSGATYALDRHVDFIRTHVESLEEVDVQPVDEPLRTGELCKVAVVATRGDGVDVARELAPLVEERLTLAPTGSWWVDVLACGTTKLDGARLVMDELGCTPDDVLAVGDSMNDACLMEGLPHGVAVANAMPSLKELCSYEIGPNVDGSVLELLMRIAEVRELAGMAG